MDIELIKPHPESTIERYNPMIAVVIQWVGGWGRGKIKERKKKEST